MLEVLRGAEVSDVAAVVTRWFGGTLLGAGGLVRAYGDAVRAALAHADDAAAAQLDPGVTNVGEGVEPVVGRPGPPAAADLSCAISPVVTGSPIRTRAGWPTYEQSACRCRKNVTPGVCMH